MPKNHPVKVVSQLIEIQKNLKLIQVITLTVQYFPLCFFVYRSIQPVVLDSNYVALKNQVIKSERRILKELGFCVHVKHPHKMIVVYLQVLGYEKNKELMQLSWNYMNDSLRSDVFIRYEPETVACACVYLSARELKLPLPTKPAWFSLFRVNESSIRDICRCILRLYSRPHVKPEMLEKKVEELKKKYEESRTKAKVTETDGNTPSPPLGKGHGNAWGGFISRNPNTLPVTVKSPKYVQNNFFIDQ